ncbi:hypothetical protein GMLC_21440 [Geomonas limicola]|uniref:Protein L n=1 Tax=Geomonas limicola TaxID=2740186 RepID=A0A6V8N7M6_9BACT|nr:protein L [Geomonas limicola]GFO68565.1 hypothetical protein GMLC_21440 [Geomonas limicola]
MTYYKYPKFFQQSDSEAFDTLTNPGAVTPHSGIYRCEGCGREVVSTQGHVMPPQNHHQHSYSQGNIRWRLVVGHN